MAFFLPDAAYSVPQLPQQPQGSFLWGPSGQRVSPDDIARQRELAQSQLASGMDYSPVQSPWQGLARTAQGIVGALGMKRADREDAANQTASAAILQNLMANSGGASTGSGDAVLAALADPYLDKGAKAALTLKYKHDNPTPAQPHYWETNNGSLGMIGPDGTPQIVYNDPTPKMQYMQVKDPSTGELRIIPVPLGSGAPNVGAAPPSAPVGKLTPIGQSLSDGSAGSILGGADASGTINPVQAAQIHDALGPNGQGAFEQWMTQHNIRIGQ